MKFLRQLARAWAIGKRVAPLLPGKAGRIIERGAAIEENVKGIVDEVRKTTQPEAPK